MNRVSLLLILVGLLTVSSTAPILSYPAEYGAEVNPTGSPIGGGKGYIDIITEGDFEVNTAEELVAALGSAKPTEVVYVSPGAVIDLTGYQNIAIPQGVTLAGNRGEDGAPGPLIYTDDLATRPLFAVPAPGVRITGLRIKGPDGATRESAYEAPNSEAIRLNAPAEIDNSEIYNWSYGGIHVMSEGAYIHHNSIHHVQRAGLGYPVSVNGGTALIEANHFDWYRHAIASSGAIGSGYEARYNIVGPNATSHAFDMHGGGDYCPKRSTPCSPSERYMAGEWLRIHHNTFLVTKQRGIRVRGVPLQGAEVYRNRFSDPDPARAYSHVYFFGNASVYDNLYGPTYTLIERWLEPTPLVRPCRRNPCTHPGDLGPVTTIHGPEATFGIARPSGKNEQGVFPIELEWNGAEAFATDRVEVRLDETLLYEGVQVPAPGELTVDTTLLDDGVHAVEFSVTDERHGTITASVTFTVDNLYELTDRMLPPYQGGWFGTIDRSRTSAMSDGWFYDTENPERFAGDSDRLRPASDATRGYEFLQWETPQLRSYHVLLFARGDAVDEGESQALAHRVRLLGSIDGEVWEPLPYDALHTAMDESEWTRIELSAELPDEGRGDASLAHVRLVIERDEADQVEIQVGEARFVGWNSRR